MPAVELGPRCSAMGASVAACDYRQYPADLQRMVTLWRGDAFWLKELKTKPFPV